MPVQISSSGASGSCSKNCRGVRGIGSITIAGRAADASFPATDRVELFVLDIIITAKTELWRAPRIAGQQCRLDESDNALGDVAIL
jgi:hypothetical protein